MAGDAVSPRRVVWALVSLAACRRHTPRIEGAPRPVVSSPRDAATAADAAVTPDVAVSRAVTVSSRCRLDPPRGVVAAGGTKRLEVVDLAAHPRAGVVVAWSEWTPSPPESDVNVGYASNFARALAWDTLAPAGAPVDACPRDIHALIQSGQLQGAPLASTATGVSGACCRFANRESGGLVVACDTWAVGRRGRQRLAWSDTDSSEEVELLPQGASAAVLLGANAGVSRLRPGVAEDTLWFVEALRNDHDGENAARFVAAPAGDGRALLALANTTQLAAARVDAAGHAVAEMPLVTLDGDDRGRRDVAVAWRNDAAFLAHALSPTEAAPAPAISLRTWTPGAASVAVADGSLRGAISRRALAATSDAPCATLGWTDRAQSPTRARVAPWCADGVSPDAGVTVSPADVEGHSVVLTARDGRTFVAWAESTGTHHEVRAARVDCDPPTP